MALQVDFQAPTLQDYPNAYFRVVELLLGYATQRATVLVFGFKDKSASDANAQPIVQLRYELSDGNFTSTFGVINLQKQDPLAATYTYLATLPDFKVAVSV